MTVVWNGSMKDTYLCVSEPQVFFVSERTIEPSRRRVASVVEVLATRAERALTMGQIKTMTGASSGSVVGQLHRLRRQGLLRSIGIPGRCGRGRRPQRYWMATL